MYGLRESPRDWAITRDRKLRTVKLPRGLRLVQSELDSSLWAVKDGARTVGLVASYVDDFICIGDAQICKEVTAALMEVFKMKQTGELKPDDVGILTYVGVNIELDEKGVLHLHQH